MQQKQRRRACRLWPSNDGRFFTNQQSNWSHQRRTDRADARRLLGCYPHRLAGSGMNSVVGSMTGSICMMGGCLVVTAEGQHAHVANQREDQQN
jgi:hypothetical protein